MAAPATKLRGGPGRGGLGRGGLGRSGLGPPEQTLLERFLQIRWGILVLLTVITGVGGAMLYSAANGAMEPWAGRHLIRYGVCLLFLLTLALIDIRLLLRAAYPVYFGGMALLVAVEVKGLVGMGAQRWIDLGVVQLQPSEVMKLAVVLALARYFHGVRLEQIGRLQHLLVPLAITVAPVLLVLRQPDLGTAALLLAGGVAVLFAAGIRWWVFAGGAALGLAAMPVGWQFLRDYQQRRVMTFFNPENDPLGAGYHITQSKIALGSGGLFGKGFLAGTQSHLNFVPERQTDFVFAMLAEEFGLAGALGLIGLYTLLIAYGFAIGLGCRHTFGRLVAVGVSAIVFLYLFINVAMVTGLVPVVGVPLPLVSYGGTAMLTVMLAFGLLMNVYINRHLRLGRHGEEAV